MDLWLYQHSTFCGQVSGMEALMLRNSSRYTAVHLEAWKTVSDFYFRREVVLQQLAIRRAYAVAARVVRHWRMLENGHIMSETGQIDKAQVRLVCLHGLRGMAQLCVHMAHEGRGAHDHSHCMCKQTG